LCLSFSLFYYRGILLALCVIDYLLTQFNFVRKETNLLTAYYWVCAIISKTILVALKIFIYILFLWTHDSVLFLWLALLMRNYLQRTLNWILWLNLWTRCWAGRTWILSFLGTKNLVNKVNFLCQKICHVFYCFLLNAGVDI